MQLTDASADVRIRRVTPPGRHFWYGYYDRRCPWDRSGEILIALEAPFTGRQPADGETAAVGYFDPGGEYTRIAETAAWCWQQGCMNQWIGGGRTVVYNVRNGERYASETFDIESGKRSRLPLPVYALTADGTTAVSTNFSRLGDLRPGYGYIGIPDPNREANLPEDDGISVMDTRTGENRLIIPYAVMTEYGNPDLFTGCRNWFNHLLFSPDGTRFSFLHRYSGEGNAVGGFATRLLTADREGGSIHLFDIPYQISHYDWTADGSAVCAWTSMADGSLGAYRLLDDRPGEENPREVARGVLTRNGHNTYDRDGIWMLTDTYPAGEERSQTLILYSAVTGRAYSLGEFPTTAPNGPARCDLHPRWSRNERSVCFDSTHEGFRAMYVADIGAVLDRHR